MLDVMDEKEAAKLLIRAGFMSKEAKKLCEGKSQEEILKLINSLSEKELFKYADQEKLELTKNQIVRTVWPKPKKTRRLVHEAYNMSIEEDYYWILNFVRYDENMIVEKITDIFSAAEQSSFFGQAWQRIGLQQDKVSQFLATIGKMVKELFQLVRELRVLDERLSYYGDSYNTASKSQESAEITLKGIWIDMVEQGAKNPASVYGMARELQFVTLPDLFFDTHPQNSREVDEVVDKLQFNRKVREVLKRKLRSFLEWKERSYDELKNRRLFTLKFLRQHYDVIKLYMNWVRPYLKNIKRLMLSQKKAATPDLIAAFETSMVEIEILGKNKQAGTDPNTFDQLEYLRDYFKMFNGCLLIHFDYRTRPELSYQQEYQRGPIHKGHVVITIREYVWTDEEIQKYKSLRAMEDFELLSTIDESVRAAMAALGDELRRYLEEAGEEFPEWAFPGKEEKKEKRRQPSLLEPFGALFFRPPKAKAQQKAKEAKKDPLLAEMAKDLIYKNDLSNRGWYVYKRFKQENKMLTW